MASLRQYEIPGVSLRKSRKSVALVAITLFVGIAWGSHHIYILTLGTPGVSFEILWAVMFLLLAQQLVMGWMERPYTATLRQQRALDRLKVSVIIPCYNEDPALMDRALYALTQQTRRPNCVFVVDDGSTNSDYAEIRDYWRRQMQVSGIELTWIRTRNQGKRHAQNEAVQRDNGSDVYITLDSDTALERNAIAEGLKPFADPTVYSVAGIEVPYNMNSNFLTRINGLRQLGWQLIGCSALSRAGSVLVNRGTYALYRAEILRDNMEAYLGETFFGRSVKFGDDTLLTTFALCKGKAVQQPTAFQLAAYPDKFGHHVRQWVRWMRSAFVRDFWRVRYLSFRQYGWWMTVLGWWQFGMTTLAYGLIFVWAPLVTGQSVLWSGIIVLLCSYLMILKYLVLKRSDESFVHQLGTFALAPVALLWWLLLLKPLRVYGMLTCLKMGWGTRKTVEVEMSGEPQRETALAVA